MWLLFLPTDLLPLFASRRLDWLSGNNILMSILSPCPSIKYLFHIIRPSTSEIPTNSASMELPVFRFYFLEKLIIAPTPINITAPVWPLKSHCVPYKVSTHRQSMLRELSRRYSFMYSVPFKYFSPRFSFPQSSLSGNLTLVVRK